MTRRNSLNDIRTLDDLSHLDQVVVDKRLGKRASTKKSRRNRHYEAQFIRNALTHHLFSSDPAARPEMEGSDRPNPRG